MATMLQSESRRLYSWWWDSHISPKNSKWLQDNLTDMDSKVKAMIKLIEEDADSFARRAEMYYKKRPELMKMVEEFYRAYRALAERYDHATGALRQAHNTMAKAFPNQIPLVLTDDSPSGSSGPEVEPRTPEMPSPIHTLFDFDDFDKDACLPSHSHVIKRSGTYSEENNILSRKGLKQLNEIYPTGEGEEAYANLSEGRVKKGLHFLAEDGKGYEYKNSRGLKEDTQNEIKRLREELTLLLAENQNLKSQKTSESERADKAESDVRNLKDSLSKLSFENEDITLEYKQAVERIASMETKMSQIQDEFKKLNDVIVMEAMKLDSAENRCVLLNKENQSLRLELEAKEQKTKDLQEENSQLSTENWNLKTQVASDSQRADKAESEVQSVKDNLLKSEFEMEAAFFQYRQSVERISYLEADLSRTENDFTKLRNEMVMQAAKLNSAEDRCLVLLEENRSLRLQLDSLEQKIKSQRQEHDQLSAENENLKSLITTESDRAQKAEIEVQLVKSRISELNFEKEAAVSQYQQSLEMISYLRTQASQAQEEYIKLRDEMAMEAMKLSSAEEQSLVLDNANQSLKTELGILEQKIRDGQEEISQLSAVIENLKSQLTLESERAYIAETEVQNLRESLSKSNFENESCIQQYQQSLEKISYLETQISQAQDDYKKLTDEMIAETMKSRLVDERCVLLEKANESIKLEVGTLEKEKKAAEEEVIYHRLELEKINTSLQDEHERLVKTQMALLSMENLHSESQEEVKRLGLEIQCAVHKLNDAELKNISLEEESCNIKEENSALNEQKLSSALQIKVLQDEIDILKEMNGKFENEMRLYLEENKLLQHNFDRLKEDKNELEQKHLNLTAQMEVVSLNAESLHVSLKKLQDENVELHEICKTHEEEKSLLLEDLKTMEDILVKNRVMENSLADANVELQELRMTVKALEQSCEALNEEVSTYITEKSTLISQIETITQNTEKLMEENTFLENSSSVLNLEVEGLRGKLNDVEDSLRSLVDQMESLTTERNILVSQVDTITQNKEKLMEENDFLENSLSLVNLEVEGLREKLTNLEDSLQSLYAEKEILIAERNNLVSQVETATQNTDKLMEENTFLEKSCSLVNLEVEGLRVKLKYSEDSLQFLYTEKDNLTAERNTIVSQVETMTQNTEKLMEEKVFLENSLSLVNLEVEGLRGKLKDLENSLQSLYTEKGNLTSERNTLVSQVETLTQNSENLTEENAFLVNSLSLVNLEVEGLRVKLKDYENSLQSLYTEKENLTSERNTLVSQVETLTQNSENLMEENAFLVNSLSLVNLEVEGLREKLKDLEDSLQSLYTEKENLTSERNTLVSQVETSTQNTENLTEENVFLVNSLSLVNLEVEGLREKLKNLEDSLQSLYTQKENLTAERNTLVFQVDSISQTLESVENRHTELEIKHLNLEKENKSRINEVLELESVLNLEKKGHATFVQSSKNQLSILEDQVLVLQEENQVREEEVEVEQRKVMSHQIELLVLHSFLRDMNEVISRLSWDCQKHLEASRCAEKLVSKLQEEGTIQMDQMSLLLAHNEKVKEGIFMLLRALNINDCVSEDREKDEVLLEIVLDEIRNLLNSVSGAEDEVQLLQLEMSVIITLLGQTGLHVEDLRIEKQFLENELEIRKDEVSVLQCNKQELLEINEQLRQDIEHSINREEEMKYAMGALQWQLSDSQDAQRASQTEIHKVLDEYQSLLRTSDSLREKKEALEEENSVVIAEAMTLEHLYLLFRSFGTERAFELKLFSDDAYCLSAVNNNLDREIRQMNEKFRVLETENIHLKESVACMEEYRRCLLGLQFDLHTSKYYCDELIDQVESGSNLLVQKERKLSETNKKVQSTQKKIVELSRNLECLNEEIYKSKIAREELQNENFSLSEGIACKNKEIERIGEENESLYDKLKILNSEVGTLRSREEQLTSRLQNGIDEIDRCEVEIMTLLSDTQFSTVSAAIFEEKVFELMLESESLEISAMIQREVLNEEIHSRNAYARELKEKLDDLEGENKGLKAHLDAYLPLVMSLQDGIASLQEQTLSLAWRPGSINQESQENTVASHQQHDEDLLGEDPTATVPSGLLELQKLTAKFGVLQKVIADTASLLEKERVDYNTDLEAARKEIREMQEKRSSSQEENKASKAVVTQLENDSEHSKLKHVQMMKDIQLDQVSSSPYENTVGSYGPTRIENSETDDQMLKLWEAAERACMGQMKRPPQLVLAHDIEPVEEEKSEYPSSELVAEKELSIDRLEVSSDQEWSRKVIERLASDTQRLLVLRTSMQELERKMENYEKGKQPKSLEYDTIRTKLNEAEGTVLELIDINSKLAKKAEEFPTGSSGAQEETERRRRMRISGRAQRGSEKVDRLELELQKIQYIMLKLEEEHSNDIAKAADRRPKIILGDYIHGKGNVEKPKRRSFCGCIRPKTKDN